MTSDQILSEQKKNNTKSLTISAALVIAGVVLLLAKQLIGGLFIVAGLILGAGLFSRYSDVKKQLQTAGGEEQLDIQLSSDSSISFADLDLAVTPELVVIQRPAFKVYALKDMQKFEVGIGPEGVQKALFLTDHSGTRHKIAQVQKGDGRQDAFDALYEVIRAYFSSR